MPTFVLLFWIFIAPFIAARLTAVQIVIWMTLGPYLFLPEAFAINLPGLPDIDKTAAISIGLVLSYLVNRSKFAAIQRPDTRVRSLKLVVLFCFGLMIAGTILTLRTNPEPLFYGPIVLPGMRTWDGVSLLSNVAFYTIPFFFAVRYLAAPAAHKELLHAFAVMGLVYSFLMLIEIRLSPQLHTWIYGYFQHSFLQHIRGGYRPIVFLQHGIWVGFFMFSSVLAAVGMWKTTKAPRWIVASLWLFFILLISKNMAATMVCLLCVMVFLFAGRWLQTMIAVTIASIVLLYPAVRQAQLLPIAQFTSAAASISPDRAQSLQYRLDNEDELLARAALKPLAGWGGYNREKIYDQRGKLLSVPDGLWIIIIGTRGWIGYVALFGVLAAPVIFLWLSRPKQAPPPETMTLLMIIMGNLIYVIPNATLTPIGWLVFGGLTGFVRYYSQTVQREEQEVVEPAQVQMRNEQPTYSRFTKP